MAKAELPGGVEPGGLGKRFGAQLIDGVVPVVLGSVYAAVLMLTEPSPEVMLVASIAYGVCLLAWFLLLWWMFAVRGQGPGMRLLRLQLVGLKDGLPIGWGRFFLRQLILGAAAALVIPLIVMIVLLIIHPLRQGWHDLAAQSVVIAERKRAPVKARAVTSRKAPTSTSANSTVGLPPHLTDQHGFSGQQDNWDALAGSAFGDQRDSQSQGGIISAVPGVSAPMSPQPSAHPSGQPQQAQQQAQPQSAPGGPAWQQSPSGAPAGTPSPSWQQSPAAPSSPAWQQSAPQPPHWGEAQQVHQPQHQPAPQAQGQPGQFQQGPQAQGQPGQFQQGPQAQGQPGQFQQAPHAQAGQPQQFQQGLQAQAGQPRQFQQAPHVQPGQPQQFQQGPQAQPGQPGQFQQAPEAQPGQPQQFQQGPSSPQGHQPQQPGQAVPPPGQSGHPQPQAQAQQAAPTQPAAQPAPPTYQPQPPVVQPAAPFQQPQPPAAAGMSTAPMPFGPDSADDYEGTRIAPRAAIRSTGAWQIRMDDGREIPITGLILIGRNPVARAGEDVTELVKAGTDGRMVSKTHLAVGIDQRGVFVMDRGSTNGTAIANSSGGYEPCAAEDRVRVRDGQIVSFGDHTLVVRRAQS